MIDRTAMRRKTTCPAPPARLGRAVPVEAMPSPARTAAHPVPDRSIGDYAAARADCAQRAAAPVNRTGLPDGLKAGIEAMSGLALDGVRVHRNSTRPAQLEAHAYAQGSEIHLAPGQDHHLPHEAWHVVQQMQGRVAPTTRLGDTPVNDDKRLEAEAETMGTRALRHAPSLSGPVAPPLGRPPSPRGEAPVQGMFGLMGRMFMRGGGGGLGPGKLGSNLSLLSQFDRRFVSTKNYSWPKNLTKEEEDALHEALEHIEAGTQPKGSLGKKWGTSFGNWEGKLPGGSGKQSPYTEHRVSPTSKDQPPGPYRLVHDPITDELYYTQDHYGSFTRIKP